MKKEKKKKEERDVFVLLLDGVERKFPSYEKAADALLERFAASRMFKERVVVVLSLDHVKNGEIERDGDKGAPVVIHGRIQKRKYTGKDGTEKEAVEVVADYLGVFGI
jgi:hypothetical protein